MINRIILKLQQQKIDRLLVNRTDKIKQYRLESITESIFFFKNLINFDLSYVKGFINCLFKSTKVSGNKIINLLIPSRKKITDLSQDKIDKYFFAISMVKKFLLTLIH